MSTPDVRVEASRRMPIYRPPEGIAPATVLKAGWALTLAHHSRQTDIVFGQIVNGRSVPLAGIETLVGPCLNNIPVRVTLEAHWTALDLLQHVQAQHLQSVPFETIAFSELVERSTSWPRQTQFGSLVLHQNIESLPTMRMGEMDGTISRGFYPREKTAELMVYSMPSATEHEIRLVTSRAMLDVETADGLVEALCEYMRLLTLYPGRRLNRILTGIWK